MWYKVLWVIWRTVAEKVKVTNIHHQMSTNVLSEGWALVLLYFLAAWGLRIGFLYLNTCCHLQTLTQNIHTVLGIRLLTLHDGRFVFHNLVGAERLLLHSSLPPINGILEYYQTFPSRLRVPIGCLLINPTEKDWLFPHWSAILDTCCKLVFYLILV